MLSIHVLELNIYAKNVDFYVKSIHLGCVLCQKIYINSEKYTIFRLYHPEIKLKLSVLYLPHSLFDCREAVGLCVHM